MVLEVEYQTNKTEIDDNSHPKLEIVCPKLQPGAGAVAYSQLGAFG